MTAVTPLSPEERQILACTAKVMRDLYGVPDLVAIDMAAKILVLSQPAWLPPLCTHEPRHCQEGAVPGLGLYESVTRT